MTNDDTDTIVEVVMMVRGAIRELCPDNRDRSSALRNLNMCLADSIRSMMLGDRPADQGEEKIRIVEMPDPDEFMRRRERSRPIPEPNGSHAEHPVSEELTPEEFAEMNARRMGVSYEDSGPASTLKKPRPKPRVPKIYQANRDEICDVCNAAFYTHPIDTNSRQSDGLFPHILCDQTRVMLT